MEEERYKQYRTGTQKYDVTSRDTNQALEQDKTTYAPKNNWNVW